MYTLSILYSLLIFIFVSLILTSFGSKLFKMFGAIKVSLLSEFIYSFALGFGIFGYILYIFGLLHLFYFWLIWVLLFLILIISFRESIFWLVNFKDKIKKCSFSGLFKNKLLLLLLVLVFIWLIVVFIGTVSPLIEFDSRWYHFGEAKYYLENHRVSIETFWKGTGTPSVFWPSAFPRMAELFFALFLSFKSEIAAKLINLVFGLIGVLAIYDYARRKMNALSALVAGLVVLVSGPFFVNATVGYIDLIVFGFSMATMLSVFSWLEDKNRDTRWLILAGVLTGLVNSVKLNGLFLVPIIILVIVVQALIIDKNWKKTFWGVFYYSFFAFIFSFGWYLDNKLHTGSFIYPFGAIAKEAAGNLIVRIVNLFFNILLSAFPLVGLFIFGFSRKRIRIVLFALASFLFFFALWGWRSDTVTEPRYLIPGLFGVAFIIGLGFQSLYNFSRLVKAAVFAFVALVVLAQILMVIKIEKKFYPYIFGLKSRHQFLTEVVAPDWWSVYDYNGQIKKTINNSKVLVAGDAVHTYYIDFPYAHASLSEINFKDIDSVSELAEEIKNKGFDFVLIKKKTLNDLFRFTSIDIQKEGQQKIDLEIDQYFPKIYSDPYSEIVIYKVD